jgi:hypothetical protein
MQIFDTPRDPPPLQPYREWKDEVSACMEQISGLDASFFPNEDYPALHEEGLEPHEAASRILDE